MVADRRFTIAFALGQAAICVFFALLSFFLLREFIAITPTKPTDHHALVFGLLRRDSFQYFLVWFDKPEFFTLFIPVYLFLVLPLIMALSRDTDRYLGARRQGAVGADALRLLPLARPGDRDARPHALQLDRAAPHALLPPGRLRHGPREAPGRSSMLGGKTLSFNMNRTVLGSILGSGVASVAAAATMYWITPFRFWQALLMAIAIVLSSMIGDLVIHSGAPEHGREPHGGRSRHHHITQRGRSRAWPLTFAAPVFYHLTTTFFITLKDVL